MHFRHLFNNINHLIITLVEPDWNQGKRNNPTQAEFFISSIPMHFLDLYNKLTNTHFGIQSDK